jgi:hypothetical protein
MNSSGSSNNDVGWLKSLKELNVIIDGLSTVENLSSDVRKVFSEPIELVLDLIGELSSVTKNQSRYWFGLLGKLMENSENKDSSLSHT